MKVFERLNQFKTETDDITEYLSKFQFSITHYTCWPEQDRKQLKNIVSTQIKLVLMESGESEVTMAGTKIHASAGDCIVIAPYTVYNAQSFDNVKSYEIFFNVLSAAREHEFLQYLGCEKATCFQKVLNSTDFALLKACYDEAREGETGVYGMINALLQRILIKVARENPNGHKAIDAGVKEQALVEQIFAALAVHIGEPVRVEEICRELNVSQSYLYGCVKKVMDCSPKQLISRYKIKHAQMLLKDPQLSVKEVAEAVGYDLYTFSHCFKQIVLISPTEYRKKFGLLSQ